MFYHSEASSAITNSLPCSLSHASLTVHLTQNYFQCLESLSTVESQNFRMSHVERYPHGLCSPTPGSIMPLAWCVWVAEGKNYEDFSLLALLQCFIIPLMTKPGQPLVS